MIRIFAAALFACVLGLPSAASAQCGGPYDQLVSEAYATRDSLDAVERYAPPDGPARVTASLVTRARAMSRSLDHALEYAPRTRVRRRGWEDDWFAHLGQLNTDLDLIMPLLRVSHQLTPEERAELRRIVVALAVTGCRP